MTSLNKNLSNMNSGLLGGSFDPAHKGHLHISNIAISSLKLDQLWWLVTTQTPLKKKNQFANINSRLSSTTIIKNKYKIKAQALELQLGTSFTYDTIKKLKTIMPRVNFYWSMGADNLLNMHNWKNWKKIFYLCPIIVFDRPNYFYKAMSSKTAKYFWENRHDINKLRKKKLPAWCFLNTKLDYNNSTSIRKVKSVKL